MIARALRDAGHGGDLHRPPPAARGDRRDGDPGGRGRGRDLDPLRRPHDARAADRRPASRAGRRATCSCSSAARFPPTTSPSSEPAGSRPCSRRVRRPREIVDFLPRERRCVECVADEDRRLRQGRARLRDRKAHRSGLGSARSCGRPCRLGLRPPSGRGGAPPPRRAPARARWSCVSLGPAGAADAIRKTLAMGADRTVLISDEAFAGADLVTTAHALAGALGREEPDLILFGQQSADGDGACLWAAVAEVLRRPAISQVAELSIDGGRRDRAPPDRVRIRADPRAAAGGRGGLGRDQRAALPVAQGDHGREVEAAGDARLGRRRRCPGRRRPR